MTLQASKKACRRHFRSVGLDLLTANHNILILVGLYLKSSIVFLFPKMGSWLCREIQINIKYVKSNITQQKCCSNSFIGFAQTSVAS